MRNTIIMLAVIGTLIATTAFIAGIGAYVMEVSFKEALSCPPTIFITVMFGWIPAMTVGMDLHDHYEEKKLDREFK